MTQILAPKALSALIKGISQTSAKQRENIHTALVQCAYYAAFDRNMDPAIRLFQAVGGETHKAGMSKWLSLYAPIHFKDGAPLLSDKRQKEITVTSEEFFADLATAPKWYEIDEGNNRVVNAWDTGAFIHKVDEYLLKAIERVKKHDLAAAEVLDKAHNLFRAGLKDGFTTVEVEK